MAVSPTDVSSKESSVIVADTYPPPDYPETEEMALTERGYTVFVQIEYAISAVDGADAIGMVMNDLAQGRSYRHHIEGTMSVNARPRMP